MRIIQNERLCFYSTLKQDVEPFLVFPFSILGFSKFTWKFEF